MTKRIPIDAPSPLAHRPFGALAGSRAPSQLSAPSASAGPGTASPKKAPAWAVLRLERKGRGGKETTIVEKLDLRASELERWAKSLKQHLGCGGAIEGQAIVLQGDQRDRAATWLEKEGVRKITRSG